MGKSGYIHCFSNHPEGLKNYMLQLQELISHEELLKHYSIESAVAQDLPDEGKEDEGRDQQSDHNLIGTCLSQGEVLHGLILSNHLLVAESTGQVQSAHFLIHLDLNGNDGPDAGKFLMEVTGFIADLKSKQAIQEYGNPRIFVLYDNLRSDSFSKLQHKDSLNSIKAYHDAIHSTGFEVLNKMNGQASGVLESTEMSRNLDFGIRYDSCEYPARDQFQNALFMNFIFSLNDPRQLSSSNFQQFTDAIEALTFKTEESIDLQIVILGKEIGEKLFATIIRNLTERWEIRYDAKVKRIMFKHSVNSYLLEISNLRNDPKRYRISIIHGDDQHGPLSMSKDFFRAMRDVFLWIVPDHYISRDLDDNLIVHPLYNTFLSIGEMIETLKRSSIEKEIILHIFEFFEPKSRFGLQPWACIKPENEFVAEEAIYRNAPKLYRNFINGTGDVRFHKMPFDYAGCHLDSAPLWIDNLILEHMKNE